MAKIYGDLQSAAFETLASDPSGNVTGRFWWNSTEARAKLDDGANKLALFRNDQKFIVGTNGTAANNVRINRSANSLLQFVPGNDTTAEGSLSTSLAQLSLRLENYTDAGKPAFGNAGRLAYITDLGSALLDTGTSWTTLGGGGGGGGGANWFSVSGTAPVENSDNGEKTWGFPQASAGNEELNLFVKVPETYLAGRQIKCYIGIYSPSTSNTILMTSTSYLIRKNNDAISSITNSRNSTNTALTNTVANQYRQVILDLTDTSGQINAVSVSAGDVIRIKLKRGTDTDTADIQFVPSITEVKFS